ncbi:MAG: SPASM domain-containing protein, partial [Candidatus Omnitrophica bacterium]|nr:SPASM domain-containing protein [Candidatus Omnitrophota bacterium]
TFEGSFRFSYPHYTISASRISAFYSNHRRENKLLDFIKLGYFATGSHCNHLFHCGTGNGSFTVSYDGYFRLCSSLWHPDCIYDLKIGNLKYAWEKFIPKVREMRSEKEEFLKKCRICPIINLCIWCPAHSHLETAELDKPVDYFCEVAHARAESLSSPGK